MLTLRVVFLSILIALNASAVRGENGAPRWVFLGEDENLKRTYNESKEVVTICVFKHELGNVKPPFAEVVYNATVTEVFKGSLKVGDKVTISFLSDSLPTDEGERIQFTDKADKSAIGSLRIAFLNEKSAEVFTTEWLNLPVYRNDMQAFLKGLERK